MRLLDLPRCRAEWALNMLTDYLGDQVRAADVHHDFAALTSARFTGDWELSADDLEQALMEVEVLRARMRIALARG